MANPNDFDPSTVQNGVADEKPKSKATLMPSAELDKMVADCMKDVDNGDDDNSPEDDQELLRELQTIASDASEVITSPDQSTQPQAPNAFLPTTTLETIGIIRERIELYKLADAHAKTTGESAKARRFERGLKTLNDLLQEATAGKQINVDDIPPEVSIKNCEQATTEPATTGTEGSAPPVENTHANQNSNQ